MSCPSDDVLARFGEGRVTAAERRDVELHLDACAACRELVAELVGRSASGTSAAPGWPVAPGEHVGRYPILERIGAGAMGAVYLAHDGELDRKVAIKLLLPAHDHVQLRDEARLLAKLSHPNVVAVYEVGAWNGLDFVVMEYVDGSSVAEWLAAAPRTAREVLDVFVAAGRGLAAVHRAQLVHRDVKPSNLLIGGDGRVRLGDFGLARGAGDAGGQIAGTPAYMAPAQRRGAPAEAASDQYAFCAALREGLASRRDVPARVRRAIARGLDDDPAARFPDLDALIATLAPRTATWRRIAAVGGAAALIAGVVGWRLAAHDPADRCDGAARVAGVWDLPRKAALHVAFARTGHAYAAATAERVEHDLDAYATQWADGYRAACEATAVRAEQSPALLDKRMLCLHQRLEELAQLQTVLATRLDDDALAKSIGAARALPPVATCADVALQSRLAEVPTDPDRARAIDAAQRELAGVRSLARTGKYAEGLTASTALLPRAHATAYAPLVAETLHQHALLQSSTGHAAAAEPTLREAATTAAAGGDVDRVAAIWIAQLDIVGVKQGKVDPAWAALDYTEAAVALAGAPPRLRASFLHAKAALLQVRGDYRKASDLHAEALALEIANHGDDYAIARGHDTLCQSLRLAGDWKAADRECQTAQNLLERVLGPGHPDLGATMFNHAGVLADLAQFQPAYELQVRALAIFEAVYPPDHPRIASAVNNMASLLEQSERYAEALPYARRAVALREHAADRASLASALANLGTLEEDTGDHRGAAEHFGRALEIQLATIGPDHPDVVETQVGLGDVAFATHDLPAAQQHYERALHIAETALGKSHPAVGNPLILLARVATGRGDRAATIALLERAVALPDLLPAQRGTAKFELAQALWADGRDRRRARTLAEAARTEITAARRDEVAAWLKTR